MIGWVGHDRLVHDRGAEQLTWKDIGMGVHIGGLPFRLDGNCTDDGGRGDGYGVMEPSNVDRVSRRASLLRVVPVRTAGGTVISHCPVLVVGPTILHDDTTDF